MAKEAYRILGSGLVTRNQYAGILRQIFHHARENPQIQALATVRLRGVQRDLLKTMYRHVISEIGHDELALHDLQALGEDVTGITQERPLSATFAVTASVVYMIEHECPAAYVGYLFHLEYTPTRLGQQYMAALERAGIPREAMGFLEEHSTVDVAHCKLIEQYCEALLVRQKDLDAALFMQQTTSELYARMLEQAMEGAGPCSPGDHGGSGGVAIVAQAVQE